MLLPARGGDIALTPGRPGCSRTAATRSTFPVPSCRYLYPIGDLDPVEAAPLGCGGLTLYRAAIARPWLARLEGLSSWCRWTRQFGIQYLRLLTDAAVHAGDPSQQKRSARLSSGPTTRRRPRTSRVPHLGARLRRIGRLLGACSTPRRPAGIAIVIRPLRRTIPFGLGAVPHEAHFMSSIWGRATAGGAERARVSASGSRVHDRHRCRSSPRRKPTIASDGAGPRPDRPRALGEHLRFQLLSPPLAQEGEGPTTFAELRPDRDSLPARPGDPGPDEPATKRWRALTVAHERPRQRRRRESALYAEGVPHETLGTLRARDHALASLARDAGWFRSLSKHADVLAVGSDPVLFSSQLGHIALEDRTERARRSAVADRNRSTCPHPTAQARQLRVHTQQGQGVRGLHLDDRARPARQAIGQGEFDWVNEISEPVPITCLSRSSGCRRRTRRCSSS